MFDATNSCFLPLFKLVGHEQMKIFLIKQISRTQSYHLIPYTVYNICSRFRMETVWKTSPTMFLHDWKDTQNLRNCIHWEKMMSRFMLISMASSQVCEKVVILWKPDAWNNSLVWSFASCEFIWNLLADDQSFLKYSVWYEPRHEKTCLRGLRPGRTQTGLRSQRS